VPLHWQSLRRSNIS